MICPMPRIHERGQITLPKALRERAGLASGDTVTITLRDDEIVIRKVRSVLDYRVPRTAPHDSQAEATARRQALVADPVNRRADAH